jgi:hypothetical protein
MMGKWRWFRWFMYCYAKLYLIFATLLVYSTFLLAYFSPTKKATILINYYGESNIEIVFLTIVVPFCIYFLLLELKWMLSRSEVKPADHLDKASSDQPAQ